MPITIPVSSPAGTTSGGLDTAGLLALNAAQLKIDMYPSIFWVDRGQTPINSLLSLRARSRAAYEVLVQWIEDTDIPTDVTPSTSYTNAATSITLTAGQGAWINVGDVLLETATSELIYASAVATDTLTVTRGYLGTTAAAIGTTDILLNTRQASAHSSISPAALQTITATKSNFAQVKRTAVQVSKSLDASKLYGGNERQRQRVKMAQQHSIDHENMLLHGIKGSITNVTDPIYSCGGVDNFLVTNSLSVSGALSEATWMDFMPQIFYRSSSPGASTKVLFASAELVNTINAWGTSKYQITEASRTVGTKYGIDIREYVSGFGRLFVIYHPLLKGGYKGYGYVMDMPNLMGRPLRPTKFNTNIQPNDADFFKDEYITESSFMVANETTHGVIKGVTF